jgi:hypothetical protein
MGKRRLAGLLAARRASGDYPPSHVLNTAGNRVIGSNAQNARFQMRSTVAVWQHAWWRESASCWADRCRAQRSSRASNGNPGARASRLELVAGDRTSHAIGRTNRRVREGCPRVNGHRASNRVKGSSCETPDHGAWTAP